LPKAALVATIALLTVTRGIPAAAQDLLLFYDQKTGAATVGLLHGNGSYQDLRNHAFDRDWTLIQPVGNGIVLFYNQRTGLAATGRVAANGTYTDLKTLNLSPGWSQIVPLTQGKLLFYNTGTGEAVTGVVAADGSYRDLRSVPAVGRGWFHFGETRNGTLFLNRLVIQNPGDTNYSYASTATGRILPDGSYVARSVNSQRWPIAWSLTPIFGNGILLFDYLTGRGYLALLDSNPTADRLVSVSGIPQWSSIVVTSNDMILLRSPSGTTSGNLVPDTASSYKYVPLRSLAFDANWSHIVAIR
jgi:hypothetical protein